MNKTETYINSLIPKNISGKKRKLLYSELQNHIYEKVDYYIELGYSKEDSENKAIEDFGTDKNIIKSINREFESLYHERTWWSVAVAIIISVMNLMCYWLDAWIYSADWNGRPESDDVLISFAMIFAVLFAVAFARAKKYRKMLIGIGVANIGVALSVFMAFYPQTAIYALGENILYLLELCTPFYLGKIAKNGIAYYIVFIYLIAVSVYCFVTSVRIKKSIAKDIEKPKKKIAVFVCAFAVFAIVNTALYPISENYWRSYKSVLLEYVQGVSENTEVAYDKITLGTDYAEACGRLSSSGFANMNEYVQSQPRLKKKQLKAEMKEFDFREGYEVWFNPQETEKGNGIIAVKKDNNGKIVGKAVGDVTENMFDNTYSGSNSNIADLNETVSAYEKLHLGDDESVVMSDFGEPSCEIYTKSEWLDDDETVTYYRVYAYGYIDTENVVDEAKQEVIKDPKTLYFEFTFRNHKLTKGQKSYRVYGKNEGYWANETVGE